MSSFQPQESAAAPAAKLCAAGCGFFGSPATHDMSTRSTSASSAQAPPPPPRRANPSRDPRASRRRWRRPPLASLARRRKAQPSRCAACCKKVGLTGFVCRCGKTFCGRHRYAEEHGCAFDFKGAGRDTIARANPLIKGEKLPGKI